MDKKKKILLHLILLSVFFLFFNLLWCAQTRRAVLVGINKYEPEEPFKKPLCRKEWKNLSGSLNDVEAIKGLLETKYHFMPGNIHVLKDEEATRNNILSAVETHLVKEAVPGDVCVFYFSGHGSRVKNSKSREPDKKDETLVPYDWYRVNSDIRDKELKKLYNRVLDKKAHLTVIIDACHSGSVSRGIPVPLSYRRLPENTCDAADPPDDQEDPSARGALVLSAARDFQRALEKEFEDGKYYGLFTWALLKVLRSVPADEPVGDILLRVNALMQSEGIRYRVNLNDPNLEALPEPRKKPLFGTKPGKDMGISAAVVNVRGKRVTFQAGLAAGIRKNCELQKIPGNQQEPLVRVRVTRAYGLNACQAEVIQGNAEKIKIGDLFQIDRWVAAPGARMNIWLPDGKLSYKDLTRTAAEIAKLRDNDNIHWVDDPTETDPTHIMEWHQSHWHLIPRGKKEIKLGKRPKADLVIKKIMSNIPLGGEKPRFFLLLPLSSRMQKVLVPEIAYYKDSINMLSSRHQAQYVLVGRYKDKGIQYAWMLPNMIREQEEDFVMPIRTAWIAVESEGEKDRKKLHKLCDTLLRLVKIRAWLQLPSPPPGEEDFPYRLALKNSITGEIKTNGPLLEDEIYGLVMRANREIPVKEIFGRYVYVFSIDSFGKGTLLFPPRYRGNSENHFPAADEFQEEIPLGDEALFKIGTPFGTDTYFMLTSEEEITNLGVLDFSSVRRDPLTGQQYTPLERLLYGLGSGYRGWIPITHMNWSIERLPILSKPLPPAGQNHFHNR